MKKTASVFLAILAALYCVACSPSVPENAPEKNPVPAAANEPAISEVKEVVEFTDPNLEKMVRNQMSIPEGDITPADAEAITELNLWPADDAPDSEKISDISSLKYFKNVKKLWIGNNLIEDISVLSNFASLEELEAPKNRITDISALSGLQNLKHAVFWQNRISDLGPVSGLVKLEVFSVTDNRVRDVSPLKDLKNLKCLELRGNYIVDFSPIRDIMPNFEVTDGFQATMPEDGIAFEDPKLEETVRFAMNRPVGPITVAEALEVKELDLSLEWRENIPYEDQIHDIGSLMYFQNLTKLGLANHMVDNIGVVNFMPNLGTLDLSGSLQYDLSPVANLPNLKTLNISGWRGSDISPLSGLIQLTWLNISHTEIKNIEPLANLENLDTLFAEAAIEDFTPIADHKKLTTLYVLTGVEGKYSADLSPLKGIYPNLKDKNFELK